jgi:hypothetical protein
VKTPALIQKIPRSVKIIILIFVLAKLLIFGLGYIAYASSPEQPQPSTLTILTHQFARPLAPQDGPHYFDIAKNWYIGNPNIDASNFIVFFPLYPILIRAITLNLSYNSLSASALIISNVCSLIALIFLYKLAKLDFDDSVALKAVLFLSIFPTAYFLSAPYTEGLFFALVISSLYFARLSKWPMAGILGFLAALTRLGGLLMLPVLLVEYLHQKGWKWRRIGLSSLWTFLTAAGFLIYLNINNHVWGNPFKFMEVQQVHWFNTLDPLTGLSRTWGWATSSAFPENLILGYAPLVFGIFGLLMLIFGYLRKLRPSYLIYMLLSWMLALSTSMWISVPRYVMAMFPMFILLGTLTRSKAVNSAVAALFVGALSYFTFLFALGYFVF